MISSAIHKSETVQSLGFGDRIEPKPVRWKDVAKLVQQVAVLTGIAFLLSGGVAALAIGGIGLVGIGAWYCVSNIWRKNIQSCPLSSIQQKKTDATPGQYHTADVRVLDDATLGHEWKKRLIASAETSVELSGSYVGGESFQDMLACIEHRMCEKKHLRVRLLVAEDLMIQEDFRQLYRLAQLFPHRFHYVTTKPVMQLTPILHRTENHVKLLVVDEKYFLLGGTNIHSRLIREEVSPILEDADENLSCKLLDRASRDLDIAGHGVALARVMRQQFFKLYRLYDLKNNPYSRAIYFSVCEKKQGRCDDFHQKDGLIPQAKMKFLCGGPEHKHHNPITEEYRKRIASAKKSIYIASLFFRPVKKIREALKHTRAHTTCVLNGRQGDPMFLRTLTNVVASRSHYSLADDIYEYNKACLYHRKVALFDNQHAIIGSYNLGKKSGKFDHEIAVSIDDARVYQACLKTLREDIGNSKRTHVNLWDYWPGRIVTKLVQGFL